MYEKPRKRGKQGDQGNRAIKKTKASEASEATTSTESTERRRRLLNAAHDVGVASLHDVLDENAAHLHLLVEILPRKLPALLRPNDVAGRYA